MVQVYDGVRRRGLPVLLKALEPGTDDDRMKGALWTISSPFFGKYAVSGLPKSYIHWIALISLLKEPSLAPQLVKGLLSSQHNEKVSSFYPSFAWYSNFLSAFDSRFRVCSDWKLSVSTNTVLDVVLMAFLGLANFLEPCYLVYDVPTPLLDKAVAQLKSSLPIGSHDSSLVVRCRNKRIERIQNMNNVIQETVSNPPTYIYIFSNSLVRFSKSWR